jgi:photosynthetic reaction center cytochrome c subunit
MNGWWQLPLTVTPQYPLTATLLEGQRFDAIMAFPWKIRPFFNNWRVSFGQTIDGVDVDVIQGSLPSGMVGTLYFDKKTGLLKRYIRYANTMVGRIPTQVDYDDYRDVAGVKMPFKFSYAWVSERDDWTMSGYEANVNIDNAKFGRPDPKTAGDVAGRKAK